MRSALLAVLLAACTPLPPVVEPTPAPVVEPAPEPTPTPAAAVDCEGAFARALELHCPSGGFPRWVQVCEMYEAQGGALGWNSGCMAHATSCEAQELCRSGQ